jgi:hypothetical protein
MIILIRSSKTMHQARHILEQRQEAVAVAVGSVCAEGLKPSAKTLKLAKDYANGKITISDLRKTTLADIKAKTR